MIVCMVKGATRRLGKDQGYRELPIRDEIRDGAKVMVSAWEPTPKELQQLNAGAKVKVTVLGVEHPPIVVEVGEKT